RARVSSQCWKRVIRQYAAAHMPEVFGGKRGQYHSIKLSETLCIKGIPEKLAKQYACAAFEAIGKKGKNNGQTSVALYLSPAEIEAVADTIISLDNSASEGKVDEKAIAKVVAKAIKDAPHRDFADIAIFGRMVADDHSLMVEGAGLFAHAISTHTCSNEVDFFSAVDDTQPENAEGAGHIGTLELNAACYYRYIALNVDLLYDKNHLGECDKETKENILKTFLEACLFAVPSARKNSMQGDTLPGFVLGVVRNGHPISLANAFENPVRAKEGYLTPSAKKLNEHWNTLKKTYGLTAEEFLLSEATPLNNWVDEITDAVIGG
ncbi:MAG: type I-E CRISPR-associated protein Cas7/Cse4/CasC, partial [Thermoguttaceae bacterium]